METPSSMNTSAAVSMTRSDVYHLIQRRVFESSWFQSALHSCMVGPSRTLPPLAGSAQLLLPLSPLYTLGEHRPKTSLSLSWCLFLYVFSDRYVHSFHTSLAPSLAYPTILAVVVESVRGKGADWRKQCWCIAILCRFASIFQQRLQSFDTRMKAWVSSASSSPLSVWPPQL